MDKKYLNMNGIKEKWNINLIKRNAKKPSFACHRQETIRKKQENINRKIFMSTRKEKRL